MYYGFILISRLPSGYSTTLCSIVRCALCLCVPLSLSQSLFFINGTRHDVQWFVWSHGTCKICLAGRFLGHTMFWAVQTNKMKWDEQQRKRAHKEENKYGAVNKLQCNKCIRTLLINASLSGAAYTEPRCVCVLINNNRKMNRFAKHAQRVRTSKYLMVRIK